MKKIPLINDVEGFEWAHIADDPTYAKICFDCESFWIREVVEIKKGVYVGYVDNDLLRNNMSAYDLHYNSVVYFKEQE